MSIITIKLEYQPFMTTKVYKNQVENIFPKDDNIRELTLTVSFFRAVWRGKFSFQNWYRRLRLVLSAFCALTQRKMFFFNRFLVRHVHI
jgi:hypothetical protein